MNTLIIHHLDDTVQLKLSQQAKQNGRSVEAEVKELLTRLFADKMPVEEGMAAKIQRIVQQQGEVNLPLPNRKAKPSQRDLDFSDEAYG